MKPVANTAHIEQIIQQFGPKSEAYLESAVHAAGADLEWVRTLVERLEDHQKFIALDVGCGAGHLSYLLAQETAEVVAVDAAPLMLDTVSQEAQKRGLTNLITRQSLVQDLPFADNSFDVVATRYSAHHWDHLTLALQELKRVTKPGGHVLIIDVLGGDVPVVDTHIQAMELLRDPSHVRDYSDLEWQRVMKVMGLNLLSARQFPLKMEFDAWFKRAQTPELASHAIMALLANASHEVRQALQIEQAQSFVFKTGVYWAHKEH